MAHPITGGKSVSGHLSPPGQHNHGLHSDGHDFHYHHKNNGKRKSKVSGDQVSHDASTQVLDLLELLYRLLGLHEVRLAIQLLEDWSTLPFAASALSVTQEELHFFIGSFVRRQWSAQLAHECAGLAMLQGVGDNHATSVMAPQDESPIGYHSGFSSEGEVKARRAELQHTLDKQRDIAAARASSASTAEKAMASAASEENHNPLEAPNPSAGYEASPPTTLTESARAPAAKPSATAATLEAAGERLSEMVQNHVAASKEERDQESSIGEDSPRSTSGFPVFSQGTRPSPPPQQAASTQQGAPVTYGGVQENDAVHNPVSLPGVACHSAVGVPLSTGVKVNSLSMPIFNSRDGKSSVSTGIHEGFENTDIVRPAEKMSLHSCNIVMGPVFHEPAKTTLSSSNEVIESCRWSLQPALSRSLKKDDPHKISRSVNEFLMSMPSHMLMVHPSGPFRISWDVLALLFVVYESVALPVGFAFDVHPPDWLQWIVTIFFSADCLLNCMTGYFLDGTLIMRQDRVIRQYTRTWLIVDLIATFPWFALTNANDTILRWLKAGRTLRMLRLLRLAKLGHLMHQIEDHFYTSRHVVVSKLLKIICMITLFCHWCACAWAWLGGPDFMESSSPPHDCAISEIGGPCRGGIRGSPWRHRYRLEAEPVTSQYLISLRFATGLFTGSDFGIEPGYWAERLFVVLAMLMSFIVMLLAISRVVVMLHKISLEHAEQEDVVMSFKEFMAACRVPLSLQSKVKRYLEYQFIMKHNVRVHHSANLAKLSPWLRSELQVYANKSVLVQHPLFKRMPPHLLAHCCCIAEAMFAAPDDIVAQKGQVCNTMYFLVHGKLHISSDEDISDLPQTDMPARKLLAKHFEKFKGNVMQSPGFIGASCLFKERVLAYTISSATHSELLKLSKGDLEALREEFPALRNVMEAFSREQQQIREGLVDCSLGLHIEQVGEWIVW